MANLFLTGSGVPTNAVGEVTDYYRDTATNLIYYRAALGWEVVPSLVPTPDGVGTNWLFGTGAPHNGIGSANDYYRDDANGSVYRKHAVNGWEAIKYCDHAALCLAVRLVVISNRMGGKKRQHIARFTGTRQCAATGKMAIRHA